MEIININPDSQKHKNLLHYTDFETLKLIVDNRTLQLSRLDTVNDKHEVNRQGVEEFARNNVFVSCFCHYQHEIVPFWYIYGKGENTSKVLLKIKNFSSNPENCFFTNYFVTGETPPKKRTFEPAILIFRITDVLYKRPNHKAFTSTFSGPAIFRDQNASKVQGNAVAHDVTSLGEYKTIHWQYEKETRIILKISLHHIPRYKKMFLRLRDAFFQDMTVVLNPWCDRSFEESVNKYIASTNLPNNVKNSIRVTKSELNGTLQ